MIEGLRNSQQIFYQRNLFNKQSGIILRCISCGSKLSINEDTMTVVKEPNLYTGNADVLYIRIYTLRIIKQMKTAVFDEPNIDTKDIDVRFFKVLTDKDYLISDINSEHGGNLSVFSKMRNTLAAIRKTVVPILPKTLKDIGFDLESYKEYTVTNEKKL